jgi:hypothetical protein
VAYCSANDRYLVVWKGARSIWGRLVDGRGEVFGTVFEIMRSSTSDDWGPRVAYDPSRNRFLVVWSRLEDSVREMYGRFVPCAGPDAALTAFPMDSSRPAEGGVYALAYGSTPDEFLVVWVTLDSVTNRKIVAGRRVKGGGGFAMGTTLIAAGSDHRANPDVAYNGYRNEYLVVYDTWPRVDDNVYGVRLSTNGDRLGGGEFVIAGDPAEEQNPDVAACPSEDQYAVVWHGRPLPGDAVWLRFVTGSGALGGMMQLASRDWWTFEVPLDVACGGTGLVMEDPSYLAIWGDNFDLGGKCYAQQVTTGGARSEELTISAHAGAAVVAGGAKNYLVAWETSGADADGYTDIHARIVGNTRPKAAFTVTPEQADSTTVFHFDASGSSDATDDATQLQVRWDWESDGIYDTGWSTTKTIDHQFSLRRGQASAVFAVTVEVSDGHGTSDTTERSLTVLNTPPVASFTVTPIFGDTSTLFAFDAAASTDAEDGSPSHFRWDWTGDGIFDTPWQSSPTGEHKYASDGTYAVQLEVRDTARRTAKTSRQVAVGQGGAKYRIYLPLILHTAP